MKKKATLSTAQIEGIIRDKRYEQGMPQPGESVHKVIREGESTDKVKLLQRLHAEFKYLFDADCSSSEEEDQMEVDQVNGRNS